MSGRPETPSRRSISLSAVTSSCFFRIEKLLWRRKETLYSLVRACRTRFVRCRNLLS